MGGKEGQVRSGGKYLDIPSKGKLILKNIHRPLLMLDCSFVVYKTSIFDIYGVVQCYVHFKFSFKEIIFLTFFSHFYFFFNNINCICYRNVFPENRFNRSICLYIKTRKKRFLRKKKCFNKNLNEKIC